MIQVLNVENDLLKHDWAVVKGFRWAINENICDVLDRCYHNQLKHFVLHYKNVLPRRYFTHLKDRWVILDERMTDQLKKNYYRGWDENDEHLTAFALRLDEEQAKLLSNGITITNIDKCQHYMLQIWNSGQFNKQIMIEWFIKPAGDKLYPQAVIFFNLKMKNSQQYEAASGNSTEKTGSTAQMRSLRPRSY